jgi:3-oxoacyl-[acyl-carrier protein] reductase
MKVADSELLALVTGGTRGIGLGITKHLESNGWKVQATDRSDLDLEDRISVLQWTVSNLSLNPYLLVCNAGINIPKKIDSQTEEEFLRINQVNYLSNILLIKSVIPQMLKNGEGRVIFISSTYAQKSKEGRSAYSASKAAMEAFIRTCAIEYASHNILFNSIAPGFIETDLTLANNDEMQIREITNRIPIGRLGKPSEIAELVKFLGSPFNTYITGQTINVDGGFSIT